MGQDWEFATHTVFPTTRATQRSDVPWTICAQATVALPDDRVCQRSFPGIERQQFHLNASDHLLVAEHFQHLVESSLEAASSRRAPANWATYSRSLEGHLGREALAERGERPCLTEQLAHRMQGSRFDFARLMLSQNTSSD